MSTRHVLATAVLNLALAAASGAFVSSPVHAGEETTRPAAKGGEPVLKKIIHERVEKAGNATVRKVVKLGDLEVVLTERARHASGIETSIGTDSEVETRRGGKTIAKVDFKGLDAVGGYTGLQLPQAQPIKGALLVKKLGNYDTRLLVVDSKGRIHNLPDGTAYLSADGETIFAIRTLPGEAPEYAVLDLKNHKIVAEARDDAKAVEFNRASRLFREGIVYQVFSNAGKTFVVATEKDTTKAELAHELAMSQLIRWDAASGEFALEKRDPGLSTGAVALKEIPGRGIGWTTLR